MFARMRGGLLLITLAGMVSTSLGLAGPITDIALQYQSGIRVSNTIFGDFSWSYVYGLSFAGDTLTAQVNVELIGDDPGTALRNRWETGVESAWSRHFDIVDGPYLYPILLNLTWVDTSIQAEVVTVHQGTGNMDMLNWYTDHPSGWPNSYEGVLAAHEIGHMLGLYDEYYGGAVDPTTLFYTTNTLMSDLGPVQERYYSDMLSWLELASGRSNLTLAPDNGLVPEPASVTLVAIGILAVLANRRRLGRS